MMALIARGVDTANRDRNGRPSLDGPSWIVGRRRVLGAGDFTANGPNTALLQKAGAWRLRK